MRAQDAPALHGLHADPEVMRFWLTPPHASLADTEALVARHLAQADRLPWVIRLGEEAIGRIALFRIDVEQGRAEVGYQLARERWGRGLMGEAQRLVLGHAFGPLGLRRVEASVAPKNAASLRSLERLGFTVEGRLRERHVAPDGSLQDDVLLGLLAREWAGGD